MNTETIKAVLENIEVNDWCPVGESTAIRTSKTTWNVTDNGEEVEGLDLDNAIRIIIENETN